MAKISILAGTTSKLIRVFVQNNSVTTGAGLTGLTSATSGLTAYYIREGANATTQIVLTSATLGTFTSSGFIVVDGTNMPGVYELGLPNAAIASGAKSVLVFLQGAANMAPLPLEIELTAVDNQSATYGLGTINSNVLQWNSTIVSTPATAGIPDVNIKNIANAAVSTSTAQLGVNIVNIAGTASAGTAGYMGLDWAHINAPTTTQNLSSTTIGTVAGNVGNVLGNIGGSMVGSVLGSVSGSVGSVTGLTNATIANAVWTDTTSADFTTLTSPGKIIFSQLGGAFTTTSSSIFTTAALANGPTGSGPTAAQIATAVWQDTTSGDFTVASSIGKSLYTSGNAPGAANGLFIAGTNAATTITTSLTTTFTGNLTGSAASVTGAVGSVTGNVGGNVVGSVASVSGNVSGSVASVVGAVGSVTGNVGGTVASVVGAVGSVTAPVAITSNVKKNQALAGFTFVMTDSTTHAPKTGVTVTATRSLDGGAFGACANAASELSNGFYVINLAATDMNANCIALRFTGAGSDDRDIALISQP